MYDKQPLKQVLIESLEEFSEMSPYRDSIKIIVEKLEQKEIADNDHAKVIGLFAVMVEGGLLKHHPDDAEFKAFCVYCCEKANNPAEFKTRSGF